MKNVNRIRVGFFAPDFTLKDSEGKMFRLSDSFGKKGLVLFFYMGKRCKFCLDWLTELTEAYEQIKLKNAEVIGISPDERWISERLKTEKKIGFPILKDGHYTKGGSRAPKVSDQYGVQILKSEGVVPYPAFFVIDKQGIIRFRKVCPHLTEKLRVKKLLCELDKLS
jgi:peroxiredoxin